MINRLFHTESLCPVCLRRISAEVTEEDGRILIGKECPEHGSWKALLWSDAGEYLAWMDQSVHEMIYEQPVEPERGCPGDCGLCKRHEGLACVAVLEVTDRCNLRCPVCFANAGRESRDPDLGTIRVMYDGAFRAGGNISIQISGGEPTLREDLPEILRIGKKEKGFFHIQVNTNGLRLAEEPEYAAALKEAGADLIYLQFDSLCDEVYRQLRGTALLDTKKRAIENCGKAGLGVMLVPVIVNGMNDQEIGDLICFAKSQMPVVKGIHFQPVSYFGRYPRQEGRPVWGDFNLSDVLRGLTEQTGGELRIQDFIPRKKYDAHCSFSAAYYLDEEGILRPLTTFRRDDTVTGTENFSAQTNAFTNRFWRAYDQSVQERKDNRPAADRPEPGSPEMKKFVRRLREYSFSVSGMGFQDVYTLDLERLKGCCVVVIARDGRAIPLCAYHLTGEKGDRLYEDI